MIAMIFCSNCFSSPNSFHESKKIAKHIFQEKPYTIYCGCLFDQNNMINLTSCNMQSAGNRKRAHRVEWEHMMPAENFGRHLKCWKEKLCYTTQKSPFKGRKCCKKIDANFREIEAELYNLWPSVGLVNQARSNYRFSPLSAKNGFHGCDIEIDSNLKKIDPPDRAKGIVARANLFMSERYNIRLSDAQKKLFKAWNKKFPPTIWERTWAEKVSVIEGYQNDFILKYEKNS
jgi:deoxyribonuclease-1